MFKPIAPERIALIRARAAEGLSSRKIAAEIGVSATTVLMYANRPLPRPPYEPLYDPARDGVPELSLTAQICGDPAPGRRELVARHASLPDDPLRQR